MNAGVDKRKDRAARMDGAAREDEAAPVDAAAPAAPERRVGRLVVFTGDGAGKTTACLGIVLRALGHGQKCVMFQFLKGRRATGEAVALRRFPELIVRQMGTGFSWEEDRESLEHAARDMWEEAAELLDSEELDLLVLDELNLALSLGLLESGAVLDAIERRRPGLTVVVTGRGAPADLLELADTATEMRHLKHAFDHGVQAQAGIEL